MPIKQAFFIALLGLSLVACAGSGKIRDLKVKGHGVAREARSCKVRIPNPIDDAITALNVFSELHEAGCHEHALALGAEIRKTFREKTYSVSSEVVSVFIPEDVLSEYVLESFERAYLSFLMASSYLALGDRAAAAVELRKSYDEGKAHLYNYGDDPVNMLLIASLWEELGEPETARPFWKRIDEMLPEPDVVGRFARSRMRAIDRGGARTHGKAHWRLLALGRFPKLDWSISLTQSASGYYTLRPLGESWPGNCRSDTGAVLATRSWYLKLGERYSSDYHPLLNVKSWVRLPIGIAYGVTTFAAGLGIAVGGCAATGKDAGCEAAFKVGGYLMSKSGDVSSYALAPDLRHWKRVPAAIMVTMADEPANERCWAGLPESSRAVAFDLVK